MKKIRLILFLMALILSPVMFFYLVAISMDDLDLNVPAQAVAGKKIWQDNGCVECHTIMGNGGYNAPDLTHVYSQRGEIWLRDFLLEPPVMHPARHKRHPGLKWEEAWAMIAYFKFIDSIDILGWPPKPRLSPGIQRYAGEGAGD